MTIPIKRKIIKRVESYNPQTQLAKFTIIHNMPQRYKLFTAHQKL